MKIGTFVFTSLLVLAFVFALAGGTYVPDLVVPVAIVAAVIALVLGVVTGKFFAGGRSMTWRTRQALEESKLMFVVPLFAITIKRGRDLVYFVARIVTPAWHNRQRHYVNVILADLNRAREFATSIFSPARLHGAAS